MSFSVSLLGGTGLVGQHFLALAMADEQVERVTTLSRRPISSNQLPNADKLESVVCELDELAENTSALASDVLVCCLGTTIKTAGSQAEFRRVDFDAVIQAANLAQQQGVERMVVVSAVGANAQSPFFYNRVKGEMENALMDLKFPSLCIVRPSLLLGQRGESRLLEDISKPLTKTFSPLLRGSFKRYRPVEGNTVALRLFEQCKQANSGCTIIYPTA